VPLTATFDGGRLTSDGGFPGWEYAPAGRPTAELALLAQDLLPL
jgi:hypothetical protein